MKLLLKILIPLTLSGNIFAVTNIDLDGTDTGRAYEGIGAVSAGGNGRLLIDYSEPYRSDILDFLFKPKFGAGLQHLKVEIGGGTSSGSGSVPSHAITQAEVSDPVSRGHQFWMMKEARNRNPDIILDCLPWAYPYWLQGSFCINCFCCPYQDTADYLVAFLEVARNHWGLELDWIGGASNEKDPHISGNWTPWLNWIVNNLRTTLDSSGYGSVKIQAPEGSWSHWDIFDQIAVRPDVDAVIDAVGYHYVDQKNAYPSASDIATGKPLWSSEDSVSGGNWTSAKDIVRRMNELYRRGKITKMEIWCPFDGCGEDIHYTGVGIMQADRPWSGYYNVRPAIWGVAHYTQFAEPGWLYIEGGCGTLSGAGNYATLKHPNSNDYSIIIYCENAETITVNLSGGLSTGTVRAWKSTSSNQFIQQSSITPVGGSFSINCSADSVYSLTTTTGQQKGQPGNSIPSMHDLSLPYENDFESYNIGETPKYISDMQGTFAVANCKGGRSGKCLEQLLPEKGDYTWDYTTHEPTATMTIIPGPSNWSDYELSSDVYIEEGEIYLAVRKGQTQKDCGYAFVLEKNGTWKLHFDDTQDDSNILNRGSIAGFDGDKWHNVKLRCIDDRIDAYVDHLKLCSVTDSKRSKGQPSFGGSFKLNQYDNISVKAAGKEWTFINQSDPVVNYSGSWWYYAGPSYMFGDCKYTASTNASATYPFFGRYARIWGTFRYDCGYMDVYIDNNYETTIDGYNRSGIYGATLYETDELDLDNHTIKVVVKGQKNPASSGYYNILEAFSSTPNTNCPDLPENLSLTATASASSQWSSDYSANRANDANYVTRWNSAPGDIAGSWLEMDFGSSKTFSSTRLTEFVDRIQNYKIQYYNGQWKDACIGNNIGNSKVDVFEPVTGRKARLYVINATTVPSIYEFEIYQKAGNNDINTDGDVNLKDIAFIANKWIETNCNLICNCDKADIYHDGIINFFDYSVISHQIQK